MNNPKEAPSFTRRQLEWLESMFPELIGTATTTEAQLRISQGQRAVVHVIRSRVKE